MLLFLLTLFKSFLALLLLQLIAAAENCDSFLVISSLLLFM